MMKRKGLSVAVSVALATAACLPAVGYTADMTINDGSVRQGLRVNNSDRVTVTDGGTKNSAFTDNTRQILSGKNDAASFATSTGDAFSVNAVQAVRYGISSQNTFTDNTIQYVDTDRAFSSGNRFSGHSKQNLDGQRGTSAALSTSDVFDGNSSQLIGYGLAKDARFSGNAQQYVATEDSVIKNNNAVSQNSHFSEHSIQVVDGFDLDDGAGGKVHYQGKSEGDTFNDNTAQNLKGTGTSTGATFHNSAKQVISDTGTSTGSVFNDQSSLQMVSGLTDAATFNDQSSFVVSGGEIKNATLNNTSTGLLGGSGKATGTTTVNNNAVLNLIAQPTFDAPPQQAEQVTLNNGGTLQVLHSVTDSPAPQTADVGHLTVNNGTVRFGDSTPDASGHYTNLSVGTMDGPGGTLAFNASLASATGNQLTAGTIGPGHYNLLINDATGSKDVTLKTLVQASQLDLIHVTTQGGNLATYNLVSIDGKKIDTIDLGLHLGKIDINDKGNVIITPVTDKVTRSTDALLGALSSGLFISDGEMQNVRSRRGELQNGSQDAGGVWGRYLNDNTRVHAAGTASYRLEQNGMELGGDKIFDVGNDRLALGLFGSYSKNKLKQDRGNSSNVDSWGSGVYATWFGAQGYYVDGVVKYNHFSTDVRSRTETGQGVSGKFDQNGLGASLETGYRFNLPASVFVEPYVRAAYFTADGKDVTLSNGLEAKADRLQSIRGEAGVSAGKHFDLKNGMTVSPYATVAVEHEFDRNNEVRMNDAYNFNNDFSGTTGRYGLGVTSRLTRNASVYAEANYRKGEHVESPLMANAGFRVNF